MTDKKVSIKFFLNKRLNYITDDIGAKTYPLYVQIIYNRKNTTFKYQEPKVLGGQNISYSELFEDILLDDEKFKTQARIYENIVLYEVEKQGEKFTLKGIGDKIAYYTESIIDASRRIANASLNDFFRKELSTLHYNEVVNIYDFTRRLSRVHELLGEKDFIKLYEKVNSTLASNLFIYSILIEFGFVLIPYSWLIGDIKGKFSNFVDELFSKLEKEKRNFQSIWFAFEPSYISNNKIRLLSHIDNLVDEILKGRFTPKLPEIENISGNIRGGITIKLQDS